MKKIKYLSTILAACMLVCAMVFTACGKDDNTEAPTNEHTEAPTSNKTENPTDGKNPPVAENMQYSLRLVDYKGDTYRSLSGVLTLEDGKLIPLINGEASFEAEKGSHTATLEISSNELYVDDTCIFTEEAPDAVIPVYSKVTSTDKDFYASDYGAGYVDTGATYVKLKGTKSSDYEGERSFFIFRPTRDGIYKISVISDKDVSVGCYGGSVLVVLSHTSIEPVDNTIELPVHKSSITADGSSVSIIGLTTDGSVDDCVLVIERVADMPADIDWETPELTQPLSPVKLAYQNKKVTLTNLDLMDENLTLVFNNEDGFYHLGTSDGSIVYVKITADNDYFGYDAETKSPLMSSFKTITETSQMYALFYDENGNLSKKEDYNKLIGMYADMVDSSGVYPLDEMLEYIIKNHGRNAGWWDYESSNCLYTFFDVEKPPVENAWLFAACLVEVEDIGSDAENAILVNPEKGTSLVGANDSFFYAVNEKESISVKLTVEAGKGISVIYGGQTFNADENGIITVSVGEGKSFAIVGSEELTDAVEVSYSYEYV